MSKEEQQPKLLKLISVLFKEAALDSPTFRASANHYHHQIEQTEQWMDGLLKFIRKFPQFYTEFKDFYKVMVDQLNPSFISDGLIDQDYTLSALTLTQNGLARLWSDSLKLLKINEDEFNNILNDAKNDIKKYREHRKAFELAQSKYDMYLSKYSAQSKTKEPSSLREDAFQLSEVRKAYIHISMEICIALTNVQKSLDSALVALSSHLWKDVDSSDPRAVSLQAQIEKIYAWAKACDFSLKILSKDMNSARRKIEESAILQFVPSRDLAAHDALNIDADKLLDLKEPVYEQHGWLFMKTTVGKPSRQIWVRRWAFVKNGIFGLLNLSPSKTFVQETDKIGVLLCNVKYAPNEERRFCFEVKTINTTIILQAETLKELKYWLKVFATEKKRSLESIDDSEKSKTSAAFGRYPPLLSEFASTATTSCDFELTSGKIEINNNNGTTNNVIATNNLSKLMNSFNKSFNPNFTDYVAENINDVQFSKQGVFQEPILNTPISTRLTKAAIIAHAFLAPTQVPTAINANIWGTVNWGMYYLVNPSSSTSTSNSTAIAEKLAFAKKIAAKPEKLAASLYPSFYPKELVNYDIQMRALLDTELATDDHCLLSFKCIWSPNSKQELSGKCFVTMDYVYFYMNSMGFVSLLKKEVDELISVESHTKKNWEILKLYTNDGLNLRAKIFLEDAKLIAKKMEVLVDNKTAEKPKTFKELVFKLLEIDKEFQESKSADGISKEVATTKAIGMAASSPVSAPNGGAGISVASPRISKKLENIPSIVSVKKDELSTDFKLDYTDEYSVFSGECQYNVPARALFHTMYGDRSTIFKKVLTLIGNNMFEQLPWVNHGGKLERKVLFNLSTSSRNSLLGGNATGIINTYYNGIDLGRMSEIQVVDKLVNDEYYNVYCTRSSLELPLGSPFIVKTRCIIRAIDANSCRLISYCDLEFASISPMNILVSKLYKSLIKAEFHRTCSHLNGCVADIGNYGKINKAIKLYGQLTCVEQEEGDVGYSFDEKKIKFGFLLFIRLWLRSVSIRLVSLLVTFLRITFNITKKLLISLSMNQFLIILLMISVSYNVWISGKTANSYWVALRTEKMINDYTKMAVNNIDISSHGTKGCTSNKHNHKGGAFMQRAIYSKDIQDMVQSGTLDNVESSSKCYKVFANNSFVLNYEKPLINSKYLAEQYGNTRSLAVAQRLQSTLQEIGIRRNELLVDLKILEKVEKEIAVGEWRNWLLNENNRCNFAREKILDKIGNKNEGDITEELPGAKELLAYCDSCALDLESVNLA